MSGSVGVIDAPSAGGNRLSLRPPPPRPAPPRLRPETFARRRAGFAAAVQRAFEERRLFVMLPVAAIAGLLASVAGPSQPDKLALGVVAIALAVALPLALRSLAALRFLVLVIAFWIGFCLLSVHGALFGTAMLDRPHYGTYELHVDEILSEDASGLRIVISGIAPVEGSRVVPIRRARVFIREGIDLAPGDLIRAPMRFYPVPGPVVPGGFDSQFHAYFDGIGAYGNTTGAVQVLRHGSGSTAGRVVDRLRRTIGERIDAVLAQPSAGIARALITGDQSAVADEAREMMASAGLAHVLSISGLHLTLVAGGVFVTLRLVLACFPILARHVSVKRLAAAGGILAGLAYFAISGGNVAALRATVMIILVFGAVIVGRRALTMRNVAIAALVVLLSDPASVLRPSFQLSFAAVVALIGAWELARAKESRPQTPLGRLLGYFGGIAATSLVAGAATLLFSVYHFQQTSPLGVVGNLFSLPLVGFVMMPSAMLAALMMPFGFEGPLLLAMGWSIERMLDLAALVSAMSSGSDASPLLTPFALVMGLAALGWFAFLPTWHRLIGPALLAPAVTLFAIDRPPDVLIADTTQAVALRLEAGLSVVAGKPNTFAVDVWRETYGEPFEAARIACDSIACVAPGPRGFSFAIVRDPAGFYEECGADLIVTRLEAPSACPASTIVDARDLSAGGVHWLAWDADRRTFEVRKAIPDQARPWRAGFSGG